jgi:hypothetical protein
VADQQGAMTEGCVEEGSQYFGNETNIEHDATSGMGDV